MWERNLLIVEDDPPLRDVLIRSLAPRGSPRARSRAVASCWSGRSANPPDAFVIDIGLPDADGRDVCQALRAQGIDAPVLFLTARDALTDRLSGFSAGGDDYVTKPFDIEEVVARLHALLRRAGRRRRRCPADRRGLVLDPTQHAVSADGAAQSADADRVPPARCARVPVHERCSPALS